MDFSAHTPATDMIAFKMQLIRGFEEEYRRRHDEIWPELTGLLKSSGIKEYSIFLDTTTGTLLAVMQVQRRNALDELPSHNIMKRWWAHMKDIMETNPDNSPVTWPMASVFRL